MPKIIVLDSGPLSNSVVRIPAAANGFSYSQRCRRWLDECEQSGAILLVPAIAYYECLRELERREATARIQRLKAFSFSQSKRFLVLQTEHLEEAARLWGIARNTGMPTASMDALDGDVILAAQVLSLGLDPSDFVVATTNPDHLTRWVPCDLWSNIKP